MQNDEVFLLARPILLMERMIFLIDIFLHVAAPSGRKRTHTALLGTPACTTNQR
jgi:hypothetical protein